MKRLLLLPLVILTLAGCSAQSEQPAPVATRPPAVSSPTAVPVVTPAPSRFQPYYVAEFAGEGDGATVTYVQGVASMVQKHVTLPYSEQIPIEGRPGLTANAVLFGHEVGCRITVFSPEHPEGVVLDEVPVAPGQTMAQCTTPTPR